MHDVTPVLFAPTGPVTARAVCLAERLEPRAVEGAEVVGVAPLVIRGGVGGAAVLFKYGCVVFFGLASEAEEAGEIERLRPALRNAFPEREVEAATVVVDPARDEGPDETETIRVRGWDVPRVQVIAEVLAKSVALAHYEAEASRTIDRIEPLAEGLSRGMRPRARQSELLQELGETLLSQARTIGRAEIAERPELIWELPALGRLYERLSAEYELMERDQALRRKNEFITGSVGALIDLVQQRQSVRLEWYIVILILVEIVILVYDMFWRG